MISWINVTNLSIAAAGIMIAFFGLVLAGTSKYVDKRTRNFLLIFFVDLIAYMAMSLFSGYAEFYGTNYLLTWIGIFLESLFSSLLMPMLALYMMIRSGESARSRVMFVVDALWIAYFAFLTWAQTSTKIYYVTPDNVYHRGPLYPLLIAAPALTMIVVLAALIRRRDKLTRGQFFAFLSYILIPLAGMVVQMASYGIHTIMLGTVVASGAMLINLLSDQAEQAAMQREKLAKQEASLMVLQMRPHFIYNTMMSIYYLCEEDPAKAQNVILNFSDYLRKNFTALAKPDLIPFTEELDHAKAYLAVEKVRFEGKIIVKYDTPYTDFDMPSLTLQPLVENCVKYGVDPELDPITIYIRTEKTAEGYNVIVADNGPGFKSAEGDTGRDGSNRRTGKSGNGVALPNIEKRMQMYGGSVSIQSRKDEGSAVTLHIRTQDASEDASDSSLL